MNIAIFGSGEDADDKTVRFVIRVEDDDFRGTVEFYEYANAFNSFADALFDFPFTNDTPVTFDADGIRLTISLTDGAGAISIHCIIEDDEANKVDFTVTRIETEALHKFGRLLRNSDFSKELAVSWEYLSMSRFA